MLICEIGGDVVCGKALKRDVCTVVVVQHHNNEQSQLRFRLEDFSSVFHPRQVS